MIKKLYTLLVAVLLTATAFAQAPEKMSYQAVVRDSNNALVANQQVGMQISILQGGATGTAVYTETQTPTTNANGLVTLEIGTGTTTDNFTAIDWSISTYFIKTEIDPTGGVNYNITGTSQLLSVAYALHAKTTSALKGGIDEAYVKALEARIRTIEPQPAKIGDLRAGGVVFWVDPADNTHGLVCAFSDYSSRVEWGCNLTDLPSVPNVNSTIEGVTDAASIEFITLIGAEIGDGLSNTNNILKDCYAAPAASAARSLGADWFLPSAKEFVKIYENRTTLEAVSGFSAFKNIGPGYWCSTEEGAFDTQFGLYGGALLFNLCGAPCFGSDYIWRHLVYDSKSTLNFVRAVRAF